jgi:hypothetical protein
MSVQSLIIKSLEKPTQSFASRAVETLSADEAKPYFQSSVLPELKAKAINDHFAKTVLPAEATNNHFTTVVLPELKTKVAVQKSDKAKRVLDITMRQLDEQTRFNAPAKNPFLQEAYLQYENTTTPKDKANALERMSYALKHQTSPYQLAPDVNVRDLFPGCMVPTLYGDAKQKGYTQITEMLDNAQKSSTRNPALLSEHHSVGPFRSTEQKETYFKALNQEAIAEQDVLDKKLADQAAITKQRIAALKANRAQRAKTNT